MEEKEPARGPDEGPTRPRRRSLGRLRLQNGVAVLYVAMGAMAALVVLDTVLAAAGAAERTLVGSAFEAFKLIAVTVLGYIFGAEKSGPEE